MRLNLEEGFRRVTWSVSMGVLIIGIALIATDWWSALVLWNQDDEPPVGVLTVYGPIVGFVTFPKDSTEAEIKDALDNTTEERLHAFHQRVSKGQAGAWGPPPVLKDDLPPRPHFRELSPEEEMSIVPLHPYGSMPTYIYQPRAGATSSVLYHQRALLKAEANRELSPEGKAILPVLRNREVFTSPLPDPLRNPFGGWVLFYLLVLAFCVTAPWAVFFLVRWIILGFSSPTKGS